MGREDALEKIRNYLASLNNRPLVVHGVSGSGKTALMAEAAGRIAVNQEPGATVLTRFIGQRRHLRKFDPCSAVSGQLAQFDNDLRRLPT